MTLRDYLLSHRGKQPEWLADFHPGDEFLREEFFASRIVFYPGSGTDGHPVKVFGSSHSAHCFIYADYGVTQEHLESELAHATHGFAGYHQVARLQLKEHDFVPRGSVDRVHDHDMWLQRGVETQRTGASYAFLEVLERDGSLDDAHGAHRLAILFLGADGIAMYDALFCQNYGNPPPFAVVLADHPGFGGNYDRFGSGGLLERTARQCGVLPPWLFVADNTTVWKGFECVPAVDGDRGGMHNDLRALHRRVG